MEKEDVRDFSWARLEFAAVAAVALMFACLLVGQTAQHYVEGAAPAAETVQAKPTFNAIDYATTGATRAGTVIIGPCNADPK